MESDGRRTIAWLREPVNPHKTTGIRELGPVDIAAVRRDILTLADEAWDRPEDFAANYNKTGALHDTAHIIFRFSDRRQDPSPTYDLDVWTRWEARLQPIMDAAVRPYGYARGFFPRIMLAKLPAGAFIAPHTDGDPRYTRAHKIHIPVSTNPGAVFFIEGARHHLKEGIAYEVNNAARHAVANGGATDRIHFIFEYLDAGLQTFAEPPQ